MFYSIYQPEISNIRIKTSHMNHHTPADLDGDGEFDAIDSVTFKKASHQT